MPVIDEQDFEPIAREGAQIAAEAGIEVGIRVVLGEPAERMVEAAGADNYDLVVVGHRGLGGVRGLILGSVAKRVAESAPCPVLIVRGNALKTIKRVLVGIDGSEQALKALVAAIELTRGFDAHLTLLYLLDTTMVAAVPGPQARREMRLNLAKAGEEALKEAAESCIQAGGKCDSLQAEGRPANEISRRAKEGDYDLVVVGRRGMGGLVRFALGSVSDVVLRSVNQPVLIAGERAKSR
jgi:nucleotide-binding universal stress UspA family protein